MNAMLKPEAFRYTAADAFKAAGVKDTSPFEHIVLPFPLWAHQIRALNKALRMQRFGLYHRPRLGKTFVFLLTSVYYAHYGVRSIILAPPILFKQLGQEWERLENNPFSLHQFKHGPEARDKLFKKWKRNKDSKPDVLLMTREIFVKEYEWLYHLGYTALTWDECHQGLAKATTKAYEAVSWFARQKSARLCLSTGTPVPTSPMNAYPIIKLTNPGAFYDLAAFERQHVLFKNMMVKNKRGSMSMVRVYDQPLGISGIHQALYEFGDRETGEGVVLLNKPAVQVVPVQLSGPHAQLYQQIGISRLIEFSDGSIINATQAAKLRQVLAQVVTSPNEYGGSVKENAVIAMLRELIDEYPEDERIVVFSHYNLSCETLHAALKDRYGAVLLYGQNTKGQNQDAVDKFTSRVDGSHRVLVCSTLAGGVGLTLGHVSSVTIFAETPETYGHLDQAMSRVLMVGKEKQVDAYLLQAMGTLWEKRVPNLLDKTKQIQQVNMDKSTLLDELMLRSGRVERLDKEESEFF